jgi:hypothetical protein
MVDNVNPVSQFHPYQPQTATPNAEKLSRGGLGAQLSGQLDRARTLARNNSGMVLGGLAALAIGAGLMRRRSMAR